MNEVTLTIFFCFEAITCGMKACAMRIGAKDSDAYMAEWRRTEPAEVTDDLEKEADTALADILATFDSATLKALVKSEGWSNA